MTAHLNCGDRDETSKLEKLKAKPGQGQPWRVKAEKSQVCVAVDEAV